jgi:hypothetical protein
VTVARIYMNISPSPLEEAVVTVSGYGINGSVPGYEITDVLEVMSYTTTPTWPSNSTEVFFMLSTSAPGFFTAYSKAVGYPEDGEIGSGNILFIVMPRSFSFNGVEVGLSAFNYHGSIDVTL